jgi:hypothetical protein
MVRTVDTFRLARDDDFKRRVAESGMPAPRSLYREDGEYGEVVASIRRGIQKLRLSHQLGRGKPNRFTRDQRIAIIAVGVAIVFGIATVILTLTVPEVRRFIGLDRSTPQAQPPQPSKAR